MPEFDYDLMVIGSGPAGQRAAIQAAKLEKRVAIVERKAVVGGVCINTGTIPSKTLREAVLYFSGYRLKEIYGESYTVKQNVTMTDLLFRTDHVIRHEIDVTRHQLLRNRVEVLPATASVDLTARSMRGSAISDFPLQESKKRTSFPITAGKSFAGTANSGASSVRLRSMSGTIRVTKR